MVGELLSSELLSELSPCERIDTLIFILELILRMLITFICCWKHFFATKLANYYFP